MEVRRETLHGHAATLPIELVGADDVDLVILAAGGCIYDDDDWALAVLKAARKLAPAGEVDEERRSGPCTTLSAKPKAAH